MSGEFIRLSSTSQKTNYMTFCVQALPYRTNTRNTSKQSAYTYGKYEFAGFAYSTHSSNSFYTCGLVHTTKPFDLFESDTTIPAWSAKRIFCVHSPRPTIRIMECRKIEPTDLTTYSSKNL